MGPYCKFCNMRCFVPVTDRWPNDIADAYWKAGEYTIAATCEQGKALEKQKIGVSYDDAMRKV